MGTVADGMLSEGVEAGSWAALATPVERSSNSARERTCVIELPKIGRDTSFSEPITGAAKYLGNGHL